MMFYIMKRYQQILREEAPITSSSTPRKLNKSKGGDDEDKTNQNNIYYIPGLLLHQLDQKTKNFFN